jgi:hypothetical protein
LRIIIIIGFLFVIPHFEENPVVISIVILLCIFFLLILGDDQINIYSDRIEQTTNSLWSLLFTSKATVYYFKDIKAASLPPRPSAEEVTGYFLFALLLPKNSVRNSTDARPIYLDLKNGKTAQLLTNLGLTKMQMIVDTINAVIKNGE